MAWARTPSPTTARARPPSRSGSGPPYHSPRAARSRIAAVSAELPGRLLLALVGAAQHDPRIRTELLERLIYPRREASARAIRDAQARGLLRDDVNPYIATDLFYGPIFYRMIMGHEPATERFATQIFERVLEGMAPNDQGKATG